VIYFSSARDLLLHTYGEWYTLIRATFTLLLIHLKKLAA